MPQCEKITVDIPQNSPVFTLYQKMKGEFGVTDEVFDRHGYYEVNYHEPGRPPLLKGVEDCYVSPADVLDLGYDNPKKYRKAIEGSLGKQMPWPLSDENSAYPFSPEMKAFSEKLIKTAKAAIGTIDEILEEKGLEKGSAERQRLTALCVYHFAKFPDARTWSGLEDDKRQKWLKVMPPLAEAGLGRFQEYLLKNGGLGLWFHTKYIPTMFSTTGLETLLWNGGTGHNYLLYGLYDMAGLKPQFAELAPFLKKDGPASIISLAFPFSELAVRVGDEYFFPDRTEKISFYPTVLRHQLFNDLYLSLLQRGLVSGKQVDLFDVTGQLKMSLYFGNDLNSTSCALRTFLAGALSAEGDEQAARAVIDTERVISSGSVVCLLFGGLTLLSLKEMEQSERLLKELAGSPNNDSRTAALLYLATFRMGQDDDKGALELINSALEIEPDNPSVLFFAGAILSMGNDQEMQRGEEFLTKVISLSPKTSDAYHFLGYIHAKQGKFERAADDIISELKLQPKNALKSFYILGWSLWNAGRKDDAGAAWARIAALYEPPIRSVQLGKDGAKKMFDDLKDITDKFPFTADMLADQGTADLFSYSLLKAGDALLYHDELTLAKEAYLKALEFRPSAKLESAVRWELALIYQQTGEMDKALLEVGRSIERGE